MKSVSVFLNGKIIGNGVLKNKQLISENMEQNLKISVQNSINCSFKDWGNVEEKDLVYLWMLDF